MVPSKFMNQVSPIILPAIFVILAGCSPRAVQAPIGQVPPLISKAPTNEEELAASEVASTRAAEIAFLSDRDHPNTPGIGELYLMKPDGSELRRLSCNLQIRSALVGDLSGASGHLSWSASMRSFLLAFGDLQRINLTDDSRQLLGLEAWHISVSDTANTLAAMVTNRVTGGDIAVLPLDGSRPITVTNGAIRSRLALPLETPFYGPAISPDGDNIAFLNSGRIFHINRATLSSTQLTSDIMATWPISWSPDGQHIAFAVPGAGGPEWILKVLAIGTSEMHDLYFDGSSPAWSPDGNRIAFVRSDTQIWSVDVNGSDLRQLTFTGQNCCPMWIANPEVLTAYVRTECVQATPTPETQAAVEKEPTATPPPTTEPKLETVRNLSCSEVAELALKPIDPPSSATQDALEARSSTIHSKLLGTWCVEEPGGNQVVVVDPDNLFSWSGALGTHYNWSSATMVEWFSCALSHEAELQGRSHWDMYTVSFNNDTLATLQPSDSEDSTPIILRKLIGYSSKGSVAEDIVGKWRKAEAGSAVTLGYTADGQVIEYLEGGASVVLGQYSVTKREGPGHSVSFSISRARFSLPIVMGGSVMTIGDRCDETPDNYYGLDKVYGIYVRIE